MKFLARTRIATLLAGLLAVGAVATPERQVGAAAAGSTNWGGAVFTTISQKVPTQPKSASGARSATSSLALPCVSAGGWYASYAGIDPPPAPRIPGELAVGILARGHAENADVQYAFRYLGRTPQGGTYPIGTVMRLSFYARETQPARGGWSFKITSGPETVDSVDTNFPPLDNSVYRTNDLIQIFGADWRRYEAVVVATSGFVRFAFWNSSISDPKEELDVTELNVETCGLVAPSEIGLVVAPAIGVSGSTVSLAARVSNGPGIPAPTGSVAFRIDGATVGSAPIRSDGTATLDTGAPSVGIHSVTADFAGVAGYSAATSTPVALEVRAPIAPTVTLNVTTGSAPLSVIASASSAGLPVSYAWSFGDGGPAKTGASTTNVYSLPGTYRLSVVAERGGLQETVTRTIVVSNASPLVAVPGTDRTTVRGSSLHFDGRGSSPSSSITSYQWTFNDGGPAAAVGPIVDRVFPSSGQYAATLTISGLTGSASATTNVSVTDPPTADGGLRVIVTSGGVALVGAHVYVGDELTILHEATTGATGLAVVDGLSSDGLFTVYVWADNYLPFAGSVVVVDGRGALSAALTAGSVGVASIDSTLLTPAEITALGIDTTNPANQSVTSFTASLDFGSGVPQQSVTSYINGSNQVVATAPSTLPGGYTAVPFSYSGPPITYESSPGNPTTQPAPFAGWMVVPGAISMLKDFFRVSVIVASRTPAAFSLRQGTARLTLPAGLSMIDPSESVTSAVIQGGTAKTFNWLVRGDASGDYSNVQFRFDSVLGPIGVPVSLTASNVSSPIRVRTGAEAFSLRVLAEGKAALCAEYRFKLELKSLSPNTLNGVAVRLGDDPKFRWEPGARRDYTFGAVAAGATVTSPDFVLTSLVNAPIGAPATLNVGSSFVLGVPSGPTATVVDTGGGPGPLVAGCDPGPTENVIGQLFKMAITGGLTVLDAVVPGLTISRSDPVNTTTGSFSHSTVDLARVGLGQDVILERVYDSRSTYDGPFGPTWGWSFGESLDVTPSTEIVWRSGTGMEIRFARNADGTFSSPPGVLANLRVLGNGTYEFVRQSIVTSTFDATGLLVSRRDRAGQGLSFAYTAAKLSTVTDQAGAITTLTYAAAGIQKDRLIRVNGSDGRIVRYGYTAGLAGATRLSSVIDARNKTTTFTYTAAGLLASEVDPKGQTRFLNTYDQLGRVITQADPLGNLSTFAYDDTAVAKKTTFTDTKGTTTVDTSKNNVLQSTVGPTGAVEHIRDARLNLTSTTDELSNVWTATYDERGNLLTRTSPAPLGYVERWTYDQRNNPLTYQDRRGLTATYTYDNNGWLATEAFGALTTTLIRNPSGTLASITDPRGAQRSFSYDLNGNVVSATEPMGGVSTYTYDSAGRLQAEVEPRGNVAGANPAQWDTRFTYDKQDRVLATIDQSGTRQVRVYDDAGNVATVTASNGGVTSFAYNTANEVVTRTDPDGGITTFGYSTRGELTSRSDPVGGITTWTYDPRGRVASMTEPRGNAAGGNPSDFTWTYGYDSLDRRVSVTDPLGRVTSYSYDPLGRVTSSADPAGTSAWVYDGGDNVTSQTRSGIGTRSTTFDELSRPVATTDERGKVTRYAYDLSGNLIETKSPTGSLTTYTYDNDRRRTSMVQPRGNVPGSDPTQYRWTYGYDMAGNQTSVTSPLGLVTATVFGRDGLVSSVTDAMGVKTTYAYDSMDRLKSVSKPSAGKTAYTYDLVGRLATRSDPVSNAVYDTYSYDLAGRLRSRTEPGNRLWTFGYDANDNLTEVVDAVANAAQNPALGTTTYAYDRFNRLTQRSYSDATPPVSYTYDAAGRTGSMTDQTGSSTYTYDAGSRLTGVTKATTGGTSSFGYAYDEAGNVTSRTYPGGTTTTYGYDDDNRLASASNAAGTATYSYDADANPTSILYPNATRQNWAYDRDGRVTQIATLNPAGGPIRTTAYTRNAMGSPVAIDISGPAGIDPAASQRLTYDNSQRLLKACYTTTTCNANNQYVWTYDVSGNRITDRLPSRPGQGIYSLDQTNGISGIQPPNLPARAFQYNANGSLLSDGLRTLTYNVAGDVATISNPVSTIVYQTDGNGNRATETTITGTPRTTRFEWDEVGPYPMLATETTGTTTQSYTYGLGLISATNATTTNYFHPDAVGSITNITTATGSTTATYNYDPFGNLRNSVVTNPALSNNPILFAGERFDQNTGYYNLRARLYDPALGRFTTTDPLSRNIGDTTFSPYTYAANRPGTLTDPTGQREAIANTAWDWTSAIGGGIKDGVIGFTKTPEALWYAILASPSNLRKLPGGITTACFEYAGDTRGIWGAVKCEIGVFNTATGIDAFGQAAISCHDATAHVSATELQCMTRKGIAAVTEAYLLAKTHETITKPRGQTVCRNSFTAETRVLMADGTTKPITDVRVGDHVLATDPATGKTEPHQVVELINGEGEKHLVDIKIHTNDGERTIITTRGHPFWVDDQRRWLRADALRSGDQLLGPDGTDFAVVGVRTRTEYLKVHNLTIEGIHSYYVLAGNQPVLAHNQSSGADVKGTGRQVRGKFPQTASPGEVLYRADSAGNITNYQIYDGTGRPLKRVDLAGRSHGGVATPHVQDFETNVNPETGQPYVKQGKSARPALPDELPC
jgi:RHS repeat-associated protein